MADQGTRAAMVDPGIRAAMADPRIPWAMADQGTLWAMAGNPPPQNNFLGEVHNLWGGALEWTR